MKKIILLVLVIGSQIITAQSMDPEKIVKANLDAYNNHDIELFMSFFSEDITLYNFNDGKQNAQGIEAVSNIYEPYFKASPELHSKILKRIVFDAKVIDHEYITGARGSSEPFEIVMIYEVKGDKITKMTAIRNAN